MISTRRLRVAFVALALVVAACGTTTPAPASQDTSSPSAQPVSGSPSASPSTGATESPWTSPSPSPSPSAAGVDPLLGTDGRFTILLMGSDYRPSSPGNRTDAIMVVSLDPASGRVGVFSVPRDTTQFPMPGGGSFDQKLNALYQWYQSRNGNGLVSMKRAISAAFGIEVDFAVLTGFAGVRNMVNAVGGVRVTLAAPYYDPAYWVNSRQQGWGLPAGTSQLNGDSALIMARSRKGDNDFGRSRRQQILVAAALDKVRAKGVDILPALLSLVTSTTVTDLPLARAADLFALVSAAKVATAKREVFGPSVFATSTGGTGFALKIAVCRAWIQKWFPPANPGATWPTGG